MESELPRSHGEHFKDDYLQPVEDEPQQEKRSMLGKMKDKARKIKKTLKSYGQGHDDHDDQHPLAEEDADDNNDDNVQEDEIVKDPKIHGAPIYDSKTVVATQAPPTVESALGVNKGDLEKLPVLKEDHYASITQEPPIKFEAEKSRGISDDKQVPIYTTNVEGRGGDLSGNIGSREEEYTNEPKKDQIFDAQSNYETEVVDSTGTVYDSTTVVATQAPPTVESALRVNKGDSEKLPVLKEDHYASITQEPPIKFEAEKSRGISDDKKVPISTTNVEGRGGDLSGNVGSREEEDTNEPKKDQIFDAQSNYETEVVDSTGTVYDSTTVVATQAPPTVESALGVNKGDLEKLPVLKEDQYAPVKFEDEISRGISDDKHVPISTGIYNEPDNANERSGANVEGRGGDLSGNVGRREEEDTNLPKNDQIFDAPSNYETEVVDSTGTGIYGESRNKPNLGADQQIDSTFGNHDALSPEIYGGSQNEPNLGANQQTDSTFESLDADALSPGIHDESRNKLNLGANQQTDSTFGSHDALSPGIYDRSQNKPNLGANQQTDSTFGSHDALSLGIYDMSRNKPNLGTNQQTDSTFGSHDALSPGIHDGSQSRPNLGANQQIDSTFESQDALSPGIYDGSQNKPDLGANQQTESTFESQDALSPGIYDGSQNKPDLGANQQTESTFGSQDALSPGIYDGSQNKPDLGANQQTDNTFESQYALSPGIYDGSQNKPNLEANQQIDSTFGSRDALYPGISDEPKNSPKLGSTENFGSSIGSHNQFSPEIYEEPRTNVEVNPKQNHDNIVHSHDQISSKSCKELLNNLNLGTNQNLDSFTGNLDELSLEPTSTKAPTIKSFDTENSSDDQSYYNDQIISSADLPATNEAISTENSVDSARGYDEPNPEKEISTNTVTAESFDSKYPIVDPHHASETETPSSPKQNSIYTEGMVLDTTTPTSPVPEKLTPVSPSEKSGASSVKDYLTENSKPSEDEVHSKVILEPISTNHSVKDDEDRSGTPEIVTDAVHKPGLEKTETVSSESQKDGGGGAGVAMGMVNMIRGQYNSWMGNADPEQSSQGESIHGHAEDDHAKTAVKDY